MSEKSGPRWPRRLDTRRYIESIVAVKGLAPSRF